MQTCEKQSVCSSRIGRGRLAWSFIVLICLPIQANANDSSATGRAVASVIDPVSVAAHHDLTFAFPGGTGRTRAGGQGGQLEITAAGQYEFSVAIEPEARAISTTGDTVVVDRISAQGSHGVAGHEWHGADGKSMIRISGRLPYSGEVNAANYAGSVLVNIAYN